MAALMDELRARGCDVEGALTRFLPAFSALDEALKAKDAETAFRHAHTLKGLTANMGLTPLYDIVVKIVEPLRGGAYHDDLLEIYDAMMRELEAYRRIGEQNGL